MCRLSKNLGASTSWNPFPSIFYSVVTQRRHKSGKEKKLVVFSGIESRLLNVTFICPCIPSMSLKYNQQAATFSRSIYFYKLIYMFQVFPPPIIRSTKLYIQRQVLWNQYCCLLLSWMRWNSVPAGSSIGLTISDAVCTVLCSWWWAEEPPEICRAIYRNKYIEKTLHLVGCILEICSSIKPVTITLFKLGVSIIIIMIMNMFWL